MGEKKAQQSHEDCAWHISSFIVDASFLSRNDLKHENPTGDQAALKFMWCRYSFWQRLPRNNGCAKPTPFYWEFCQSIKIMVAERERVSRLVKDITSTPVGVPLPSYRYGRRLGVYT
ncbi:hypothetical protein [Acinetobacter baumannii]|uniref:hypothetical protein n=1 Tax=Acinetobacter baumannii TaxID=470 RepID=UPI001D172A5D|nr:hypothetical protein [Acinetobacter baumannii]